MKERGSILLYILGAIVVLGMLSGIAYKIRESGKDVIRLEWADANRKQREAEARQAATAATTLETDNAKAKIVYRTITRTVDKVVEKPVYRNVCFDADGLSIVNAALRGPSAPPAKPDKPLPGPKPALRWDRSLSIAKTG